MSIYLVIEGQVGEKKIYQNWLGYINPNLRQVNSLDDITQNSIYIVCGFGYPYYLETIQAAVEDVTNFNIDRLVVAVDSENFTYQQKYDEIDNHINALGLDKDYRIIVQHFCIEAWLLGNKAIVRRRPESLNVRSYRKLYDVLDNDPELLPANLEENLNRAQFSEKYLRSLLNDKFRNLTYSKRNPTAVMHKKYFQNLCNRLDQTGHIFSFKHFLTSFL